jgi:hypothetical protein
MQLVQVKIMKKYKSCNSGKVIGQAMWCLGVVLIVGVSLVGLFRWRIPFILGTLKLGIVLWDLVYLGHFYKQSKHFLALLNSWIDIYKNMFLKWTIEVENIRIGDLDILFVDLQK